MDIFDGWSVWLILLVSLVVVAMIAAAVWVFIKFIRTFKLIQSDLMPMGGKLAFWGTVLYLFSPIDVLPDPILFDDIGVMLAAAAYITKLASDRGIDATTIGKLGRTVFETMGDASENSSPNRTRRQDPIDVDHADTKRIKRDADDIIDIPPSN